MGCAGCGSPGEGEGSWAPSPEVGSAGRPHALVSLGRADAVALREGEEGAGSVAQAGVAQEEEAQPCQCASPGGVEAMGGNDWPERNSAGSTGS